MVDKDIKVEIVVDEKEKKHSFIKKYWLNIILLFATILSTLFAGAFQETGKFVDSVRNLGLGLPFSFSLIIILLSHELGHYFASRYHNVPASLPYFLPVPHPLVGTFGAFIKMKGKIRDRNSLMDLGAAGPFAGVIVAIPILIIGINHSQVVPLSEVVGKQLWPTLGASILFRSIVYALKGYIPGDMGLMLHPMAYAAWIGLWVTSINLIPIGQLDGGHILYALLRKKSIWVSRVVFILILLMGLLWMGWLFWGFFTAVVIRFHHPPPLDDEKPLDRKRKIVGVLSIILLVITFLPTPFFE